MTSRLGIVGAGQLALYMCEAAQALGVEVAVFAEAGDAPALERADTAWRDGKTSTGEDQFEAFITQCDVVTFDKESIPGDVLSALALAEAQGRIAVRPTLKTLALLADKGLQKNWLCQQQLPTLPFFMLSGNAAPVDALVEKLGQALVQKARTGGFDGRAVQVLAPLHNREQLWDVPSIVEPYLSDCRELAVVVARTVSGDMRAYQPVNMAFHPELNSLLSVTTPSGFPPAQSDAATDLACRAIHALGGVGVFAVEFFVTAAGAIFINEISPRVHNSGHLTLDACNVSQFEQHVRAVLDLPLVPVANAEAAAMLNILDSGAAYTGFPGLPAIARLPEFSATAYWYGKTPGHQGRKLGHINALASTPEEALDRARLAQRKLMEHSMEWAA